MTTVLPLLLVMGLLLALSAFFGGSETALFSLTAAQTRQFADSRHRLGRLVTRLLKEPDFLLIALLVGNMLANLIYFTLGSVVTLLWARAGVGPAALTAWAVGLLVVLVLVGEVGPKAVAFAYNGRIAPIVALPLFLFERAIRPVSRLLRGALVRPLTRLAHPADHVGQLTLDELRDLLEVSERRGILHADETMMLHEIVGLGQIKVADVMAPRVTVQAFDADQPMSELADLFRQTGRARLPVYRGDLDHILGWAYARRVFLEPNRPLVDLLTPVLYTAELATVEQLLQEFRRNRAEAAIVVDEYGGTAGLVTMTDVLSEIVGDIQQTGGAGGAADTTARPLVQQVGPQEYSVAGELPIHDWAEAFAFGRELNDPRLVTVGGLATKLIGRLPRVGDVVRYGNVTFRVEEMGRRRISRLRLTLESPGDSPPGSSPGSSAESPGGPGGQP
jgi:putative hemolysin